MRRKNRYKIRRFRKSSITLTSLLPNILTLIGLCCGITSLKFALSERWELAVAAIFFAAFFDVIDGALARMLKATSALGAQLDSLSDFMCFGIAPAFVVYLWSFKNFGFIGWASVIVYILCLVIRLARFNVDASSTTHEWQKMFFIGMPSTAAAILLMLPLILQLSNIDFQINHIIFICYTITIGFLAVSTIPTFSVKKITIEKKYLSLTMLGIGLILILLFSYPWIIIPIIIFGYFLSIPISIIKYKRYSKQEALQIVEEK